jgi:hypothetical protein
VNDVADAIRAEVDRAVSLLRGWQERDVTQDRGSAKWTRKEILGHLIDSALNNHQRFVRAQFGPYVGPGYDQLAWVERQGYRSRPWNELVDLWIALNRHMAAVVELVPAEKLHTPCVIGDGQPVTLEWVMKDYVRHLKHHVDQIERG